MQLYAVFMGFVDSFVGGCSVQVIVAFLPNLWALLCSFLASCVQFSVQFSCTELCNIVQFSVHFYDHFCAIP